MSASAIFYISFFIGYFLHMGLQIDAAVRSKKTAPVSRVEVVKDNIFVLGSRMFISFILLILLRNHPEYLKPILGWAGMTTDSISIATSSWLFSGMWGYMVDSLVAFIPFLKNYVPPLNDTVAKVTVAKTTQEGVPEKTTTTVETVIPTNTKTDQP